MLNKLLLWTGFAITLSANTLLPYAGMEYLGPSGDLDMYTYGAALTMLDRGADPYRYEDICVAPAEQNQHEKAQYFMTWLQHEGHQRIFTPEYATHRMSIVEAVSCGKTDPLFLEAVCSKQDAKLMQFLLEHKAVDPNASMHSIGFHKPIFSARSVAFIKILQQHGASLQARECPFQRTVLHRACHEDYPVEILEYYIQHAGININHPSDRDDYKATPLHEWATYSLGTNIVNTKNTESSLKKLDLLLKAGADHKLTDYERKTPLQILQTHLSHYERYQANDLRWPESLRFGNLHTAALKNVIAHFKRATGQDDVQSAL